MVIDNESFGFVSCHASLPCQLTLFFFFCSFKNKSMQYEPDKSSVYSICFTSVGIYN